MKEISFLKTKTYQEITNSDKTIFVCEGGARSGKSFSGLQVFFKKFFTEKNISLGICRKTFASLKVSTGKAFIDMLKDYGVYNDDNFNKTDFVYKNPLNNNEIRFFGLDDPERIKSTEFNYILMDEATDFTLNDYIILKTRLSKRNDYGKNLILLMFNPIFSEGWIDKIITDKDSKHIHSTYKDNPTLSKEYIDNLENLKNIDINKYRIYALGERGKSEATIFPKFKIIDKMPDNYDDICYGLDFGFNNPSAMVEVRIKENNIYVMEMLYKTGLITSEIADFITKQNLDYNHYIFADSAEPDRIEQIYMENLNCLGAEKKVSDGILALKNFNIHIEKNSSNLLDEMRGYSWKVDKNENILDEPVKINDHLVDAMRYALFSWVKLTRYELSFSKI